MMGIGEGNLEGGAKQGRRERDKRNETFRTE